VRSATQANRESQIGNRQSANPQSDCYRLRLRGSRATAAGDSSVNIAGAALPRLAG
jgi:hypothetical protein